MGAVAGTQDLLFALGAACVEPLDAIFNNTELDCRCPCAATALTAQDVSTREAWLTGPPRAKCRGRAILYRRAVLIRDVLCVGPDLRPT
jgi:hypothetical protein